MYMLYKLDKPLGSTKSSFINIFSASTPQNVHFAHCVPIVKLRTTSLTFQFYRSLKWANFTMGFMSKFNILPSWVKKICLYTYVNDYFIRGLPRLDTSGEHELFVTKQGKNGQSSLGQKEYRLFINSDKGPLFEKKINGTKWSPFIHSFPPNQPTTPSKIRYSAEMYMELNVALHFS